MKIKNNDKSISMKMRQEISYKERKNIVKSYQISSDDSNTLSIKSDAYKHKKNLRKIYGN